MSKTVYIPTTGTPSDYQPVVSMFLTEGWDVVTSLNDDPYICLVCFTGGSDVDPKLYGEENTDSVSDFDRDVHEIGIYGGFTNLPKVGICRGAQLLNVMAGGSLIQHIDGHGMGNREIFIEPEVLDAPGFKKEIREDHHQGMVVTPDAKIFAYDPRDNNPEIVLYREERSLCFQPHPEWGHEGTKEAFFELLDDFMFKYIEY